MSNRRSIHCKVNEDVWESFQSFVIEAHGQKYGNLGREVENALNEYMDNDRVARLESRLDRIEAHLSELAATHTHKQSETLDKAEQITEQIGKSGRTVIPTEQVRLAIEDVAGGDERTIRKYQDIMKRRGMAYEHPSDSEVWTLDRDQWVKWAVEHVNNNPTVRRADVITGYPIGYDEIEEIAQEVLA